MKKLFNKLFNRKEKVIPSDNEELVGHQDDGHVKCGTCKKSVFPNTPRKVFPRSGKDRKVYHIKCWRKLRKVGIQYQKTGKVIDF